MVAYIPIVEVNSNMKTDNFHLENDEKLNNMDDKTMDDLANELEGEQQSDKDSKKKLTAKKRAQVEQRLAAEKKKYAKQGSKKGSADDDDGDDYLETFANGGKQKKKWDFLTDVQRGAAKSEKDTCFDTEYWAID